MTFKEIIKTIPYYKEHPEHYSRADWYYFPDDEAIYREDLEILLENSYRKQEIRDLALALHEMDLKSTHPFRQIESKNSFVRWIFNLHDFL